MITSNQKVAAGGHNGVLHNNKTSCFFQAKSFDIALVIFQNGLPRQLSETYIYIS